MHDIQLMSEIVRFSRYCSAHGGRRPMMTHMFKKEIEQGLVSNKFVVDVAAAAGMINQRGQFKASPGYFYSRIERQFEISLFLNIYRNQAHTCSRDKLEASWMLFLAVLTPLTCAAPRINITDAWQSTMWLASDRFTWHSCKECSCSYPIPEEMPHITDKCPICRQLAITKPKLNALAC